ncbi:hypothetical protein [Arenibacter certesii]|uniref:Membrane metalloprotease n=1 Tax=Arenibacter certesii TaxID=228955 RepID=A0A918MI57_9FLAO|nr:hypothetical protein [Arenibacter certesii]GGW23538.1 hypothetical protein GCM10007383_04750 [Arenibacter certesii]
MRKFFFLLALLFICLLSCSKDGGEDLIKTPDRSANLRGPGDSANEMLSNSKFKNMVIEIAYVTGYAPTEAAISDFTTLLEERTHKDNIRVVKKELPSPGKDSLSVNEVFDLEKENRTVYNDGDTIGMYIYFTDASSDSDKPEEDLVTLGAVYKNTSMVIYEATIRRLAKKSLLITTADVEAATLSHEVGHLLGLVDLGSPSVNPHQDPEAPSHCSETNCLMRAELQFGSGMAKMLAAKRGSNPGFGVECIKDLRANGGR